MKALVIYDSQFGNTEKIARAIAEGLGSHGQVELLQVGQVKSDQLAGYQLLVVGSPTQRFRATPNTTQLLKEIPKNGLAGVKVTAFDTRLTVEEIESIKILAFFVRLFGYAAQPIAKQLKQKGGELVVPAEGFYVQGTEGPLVEGELERAKQWGKKILESI